MTDPRVDEAGHVTNHLRRRRTEQGLSQAELAGRTGISRQAVYAIEANQYLPTTAVALRLAAALECRVEDLFSLNPSGEVIEGDLLSPSPVAPRSRVKVARVGDRFLVRPVSDLGEVLTFTVAADGLLLEPSAAPTRSRGRVRVTLLRDRRQIEEELVVAGCDPAVFLLGDYLRRRNHRASVVGWTMGSAAAVEALKRQEVHMAGLHLLDDRTGESNLPYLRQHLEGDGFMVVTFAGWEQGMIVAKGNPKDIRGIGDLARGAVRIVNREPGAGARVLLDRQLAAAGIPTGRVTGYSRLAHSHLEVARLVAQGQVDAGIGVFAAARLLGLDFIPLQAERYDLVIPKVYLDTHDTLEHVLDTLVSRPFRSEIDALGGYDTRETGKVQEWRSREPKARRSS